MSPTIDVVCGVRLFTFLKTTAFTPKRVAEISRSTGGRENTSLTIPDHHRDRRVAGGEDRRCH